MSISEQHLGTFLTTDDHVIRDYLVFCIVRPLSVCLLKTFSLCRHHDQRLRIFKKRKKKKSKDSAKMLGSTPPTLLCSALLYDVLARRRVSGVRRKQQQLSLPVESPEGGHPHP